MEVPRINTTAVGVDVPRHLFQIHAVDAQGTFGVAQWSQPVPDGVVLHRPAALSRRYGGLRQRTLLGTQAGCDVTYGEADGAALRETLREDEQE